MAGGMTIKEYLVSVGVQDQLTPKLNKILNNATKDIDKNANSWGKAALVAGTAMATVAVGMGVAIGKFISKLETADTELEKFADAMGLTREEAYKTKSALDVMGKSMDEIEADPKLLEQFKELRANAENIKVPDMSKGIEQVRGVTTEYLKLKQTAMSGLQWIGHYLLKYADKPLQDIRKTLGGLNGFVGKNVMVWADKIGMAISWLVRLGTTFIRGAEIILNAIKKIFDMIPDKVKMVMGVLATLAMFIRAGPIGKLMMIFTLLLLLVDDFFTYLDGGDSLLGGFWQKCIDIWEVLNKQGGAIEKLKKVFTDAMTTIRDALIKAKGRMADFWNALKENGIINNFKEAFSKAGEAIGKIFTAAKGVVRELIGAADDAGNSIQPFLVWLVSDGIPSAIGLISDIAGKIADFIKRLNDVGATTPIILGIVGAFAGFKVIDGITGTVKNLTGTIEGMSKAPGRIRAMIDAFSGLKKAISATKVAQAAHNVVMKAAAIAQAALNAVMSANPIALIIIGIAALIAIGILLVKNWDKISEFLAGAWQKIKDTFSGGDGFFSQLAGTWFRGIEAAFGIIVDWFTMIWENIKLIFSVVQSVLSGDFQGAYDGIVKIWENIVGFFTSLVSRITGVFQPLIDWLLDKFSKVGEFISGMVGKVQGFFGGGGGGAQTGHAEGVISTSEHDAKISEGNQAEAVIPLSKPNRAKQLIKQAANFVGMSEDSFGGDGGQGCGAGAMFDKMKTFIDQASASMQRMGQMSTAAATAGAVSNSSVVNDNRNINYDNRSSFTIHDSSGSPQATANAVDRMQELRTRNMKGVIQ